MSMMLCSILYKVVILLCLFLALWVPHHSSCKSFVTDPGSLEKLFLQNRVIIISVAIGLAALFNLSDSLLTILFLLICILHCRIVK